ncbi:MAG: FAD/NAD(P)-binding protein [Rickettsiales bacterium]
MRIAVIGFGFSGLMATVNLVREAKAPLTIYIIDDSSAGFGTAYSTTNPDHLLNVRSDNMSAFADAPDNFVNWLSRNETTRHYTPDDFVPRKIYGNYLQSIWRDTQRLAAEKQIELKLVPSRATAIQPDKAILTERGDAIAVDTIILATGHEMKPVLPEIKSPTIVQNPWAPDAFKDASGWLSPVLLIGTGLTAIDMVLSLRRAGYTGAIIATSRSGALPQVHAAPTAICSFNADELEKKSLSKLLRLLRKKIAATGDWRSTVDALRSYTQTLWQRLSTYQQQKFIARLLSRWNNHRHRMAPEIAERIQSEIAAGTVRIIACKKLDSTLQSDTVTIIANNEAFNPSRIINCTGLELNLARSNNTLLKQLAANGFVEPHATGLGIAVDIQYRAWGALYPHLYAMGSLLTGQLLESTAVPELRVQAAAVAKQ